MQSREERILIKRVRRLLNVEDVVSARSLIETTQGALESVQVRNTYGGMLRDLGDWDGYERNLVEMIRIEPRSRAAVEGFLSFDRGQVKPSAVIDSYASEFKHPICGGIFLARASAVSLGRRDFESAWDYAVRAIDMPGDAEVRRLARRSLAALMFWHGRLDLAEELVMRGRPEAEKFEIAWDRLMIRKVAAFNDATLELFKFLASNRDNHDKPILSAYLDYLWVTQGASEALLEESASWNDPDNATLVSQMTALAYELGRTDLARELLKKSPACTAMHKQILPIAKLLAEDSEFADNLGDSDALDGVKESAALYDKIADGTERLRRELSDTKRTIAIVGNSSCEVGRKVGGAIDSHDLIIRFSKAVLSREYHDDYGSRTDIHALPTRGNSGTAPMSDASFALFSVSHALGRNRDWRHAQKLLRLGKNVACIPGSSFAELTKKLKAPPSAGLRVCAYLHSLRGPLRRSSAYGFSFVDQIGADPSSSHYFRQAVPSMHHNWPVELSVFNSLLEPS